MNATKLKPAAEDSEKIEEWLRTWFFEGPERNETLAEEEELPPELKGMDVVKFAGRYYKRAALDGDWSGTTCPKCGGMLITRHFEIDVAERSGGDRIIGPHCMFCGTGKIVLR